MVLEIRRVSAISPRGQKDVILVSCGKLFILSSIFLAVETAIRTKIKHAAREREVTREKETNMTIQVAIAGGGIAGLCLARGLLQFPQFDVQVYEQVQQHRDKGGALALHANAIQAMELIDPALKQAYFRKANSMLADDEVEMATRVFMMEGKYTWEEIARLGRAKGRKTVTRIDLVAGYQELVPKERVHMGRKLVDVEETGNGKIQLAFADDSTTTADCLIGADGVHSVSRKYVLGKDHPAALPVNHDRWYRIGAPFPTEVVEKTISPRLQGFVPLLAGSKGTFAVTPVRYGTVINISLFQRAETDGDIGKLPNPEDFRDYDPDCAKMVEVSRHASGFHSWLADCGC